MNVSLVMFKADGSRRDFPLDKPRIILGRTNGCDLRIPLSSVSRQHCEIRIDKDKIVLRDLGSSNGTFHNGNRITESALSAGDEIAVGQVVFTVVVNGRPAKIEPVQSPMEQTTVSQPTLGEAAAGDDAPLALSDDSKPQPIPVDDDDEQAIPAEIEDEPHTPTVDLDEDPISALEAMAEAENATHQDVPLVAHDDEEQDVPLLAEDDDDPPTK
jgi:pSer/pThr/pTyr-binding forkhead associated (FHA) protein